MSKERDERIAQIPWVRPASGFNRCEGIKWRHVGLKHLYSYNGKPAEGIPDRARCKLWSKWHFTALPDTKRVYDHLAASGDYCIHHLFVQIRDYNQELERYREWLDEMGY